MPDRPPADTIPRRWIVLYFVVGISFALMTIAVRWPDIRWLCAELKDIGPDWIRAIGTLFSGLASSASAIIAILTAVVVPFAAYRFAVRQERKKQQAANKKEWVGLVRNALAKYVAQASDSALRFWISQALDRFEEELPSLLAAARELKAVETEIDLLLNPNDARQRELAGLMAELTSAVSDLAEARPQPGDEIPDVIVVTRGRIIEVARIVLKEEWEKSKAAF